MIICVICIFNHLAFSVMFGTDVSTVISNHFILSFCGKRGKKAFLCLVPRLWALLNSFLWLSPFGGGMKNEFLLLSTDVDSMKNV